MPSPLTISEDAELKRLLEHIAHDIINAGAYLRLHSALAERFESHKHEVNQTPAFWTFTANAVRDAGLLCLARIFDQRHGALSLYTLPLTIRDHPEFFADEAVRKRVNPIYAESMRSGSHTVDNQLLTEHLKLVSAGDPLTKKIVLWRNTLGAHRASRVILTGQFPEAGLASRDDCVTLLDRAFSIFNHYTSYFTRRPPQRRLLVRKIMTLYLNFSELASKHMNTSSRAISKMSQAPNQAMELTTGRCN